MGIDPVSIGSAIGLALFTSGAPIALVNAGVFLGSNLLTIGAIASVGIQYATALSNRPKPLSPEAQGIQNLIRQAIPPQRLCFGTPVTSGALFFGTGQPPYTWYGIVLAAHEIERFNAIYINGQRIALADTDEIQRVYYIRTESGKPVPIILPLPGIAEDVYLEISLRKGAADQEIDQIIARDFTDMPSTFRQRRHATIVLKRTHGFGADIQAKNEDYKRVWGESGQFNPLIEFKGAKIYDPRIAGHVLADPTTHQWTDNAALCLAHALTFQWPDKRIFEPSRLNWDLFARAADECDQWQIDRNGNTFKRYTSNGVVQSTERIYDVLESFRTAMGGDIALERGKIYPVPGVARLPEATLHNRMLIGGFRFTREREFGELVNIVKTQFLAPDRQNQTVEGPVIRDTAGITADGQPLETTLQLAFTEGDPRAQRIAHKTLKEARADRSLEVGVTDEAESWSIGRLYRVELDGGVLSKVNGVYRLMAKSPAQNLRGYQLVLREYTDEAFNFGPDDEQDFTLDEDVVEVAA